MRIAPGAARKSLSGNINCGFGPFVRSPACLAIVQDSRGESVCGKSREDVERRHEFFPIGNSPDGALDRSSCRRVRSPVENSRCPRHREVCRRTIGRLANRAAGRAHQDRSIVSLPIRRASVSRRLSRPVSGTSLAVLFRSREFAASASGVARGRWSTRTRGVSCECTVETRDAHRRGRIRATRRTWAGEHGCRLQGSPNRIEAHRGLENDPGRFVGRTRRSGPFSSRSGSRRTFATSAHRADP